MCRALPLLVFALLAPGANAEESSMPALIEAEGDMRVRAHCSGCHSLRLVTAQRGDRRFWLDTIRWMQRTQKLWQIPPAQENAILDYLATHYDEQAWGRRPPLSPSLLPNTRG